MASSPSPLLQKARVALASAGLALSAAVLVGPTIASGAGYPTVPSPPDGGDTYQPWLQDLDDCFCGFSNMNYLETPLSRPIGVDPMRWLGAVGNRPGSFAPVGQPVDLYVEQNTSVTDQIYDSVPSFADLTLRTLCGFFGENPATHAIDHASYAFDFVNSSVGVTAKALPGGRGATLSAGALAAGVDSANVFFATVAQVPQIRDVIQNIDGSVTYTAHCSAAPYDWIDQNINSCAAVSLQRIIVFRASKAVNDHATVEMGKAVTIPISANDTVGIVAGGVTERATEPLHGKAVWQPDGTVQYTPNAGYFGADSFTYTITDARTGAVTTATVAITVQGPTAVVPAAAPAPATPASVPTVSVTSVPKLPQTGSADDGSGVVAVLATGATAIAAVIARLVGRLPRRARR